MDIIKYENIANNADLKITNDIGIETWTFAQTLTGLGSVVAIYLILTTRILPAFMRSREAYKLNNLLLAYNAFQIAFSTYIVVIYLKYMYYHNIISTRCPKGADMQEVVTDIYPYFIAKHLDMLDTVFFVLRKKQNQVTFLHLYHHAAMLTWTWFHIMYHPTDNFVVVGMLNSFVHMLMYTYYGIASLGPKYAKYIWWKKHLTKVQLVQFILVVVNLHYQQKMSPCPIPTGFYVFCMGLISSFFVLFMKFYFRSYKPRKEVKYFNNAVYNSQIKAQ